MPRATPDTPMTCATCRVEINGRPTFHVGLPFCCAGCVAGGPCICSYDEEPPRPRVRYCADIGDDLPVAAPREERVPVGARR